jgi:hypothetical protein
MVEPYTLARFWMVTRFQSNEDGLASLKAVLTRHPGRADRSLSYLADTQGVLNDHPAAAGLVELAYLAQVDRPRLFAHGQAEPGAGAAEQARRGHRGCEEGPRAGADEPRRANGARQPLHRREQARRRHRDADSELKDAKGEAVLTRLGLRAPGSRATSTPRRRSFTRRSRRRPRLANGERAAVLTTTWPWSRRSAGDSTRRGPH